MSRSPPNDFLGMPPLGQNVSSPCHCPSPPSSSVCGTPAVVTGPCAGHQACSGRESREMSHIPCPPAAKFPMRYLRSLAKGNVTFT